MVRTTRIFSNSILRNPRSTATATATATAPVSKWSYCYANSGLPRGNNSKSTHCISRPSSANYSSTAQTCDYNKNNKPDVKIVEVGPRDGLQNESLPLVSVQDKLEFIQRLEKAGCSNIEVGSFVSPKWIPQMSGSAEVLSGLLTKAASQNNLSQDDASTNRSSYSILVPNLKGLEQSLSVENESRKQGGRQIDEIAIFGAASEEFTKRNINSTIEESMERFCEMLDRLGHRVQGAPEDGNNTPLLVRGYVSTVIACPYEGAIQPEKVAKVVEQMLALGCHEISLGDTIGVGTPESTKRMLDQVLRVAKPSQFAMHCHDTYGQALVNILTGLEKEIYTIDSSVAGLGGCPYAKGASGNVATEDVLYMLHGMGLSTGIDLDKLIDAGKFICKVLDRPTLSKVAMASYCAR